MDSTISPRVFSILALAAVIVLNATGNIFLKLGADDTHQRAAFLGIFNWQTIVGIACFGLGLIAYSLALRRFELHAAQIALSLQYVLAILLAGWLLREHVGLMQWFGIVLIAIGLYICTR